MSKTKTKRNNLYCLVLCAVLIAMSMVLSYVKIIDMPYGGSITLFSLRRPVRRVRRDGRHRIFLRT